jgi:hypothetical protein
MRPGCYNCKFAEKEPDEDPCKLCGFGLYKWELDTDFFKGAEVER